jgi:hypothetical protein
MLDPIHNEGIRLSTGAFRTSPTNSILCHAGELPLDVLREKELLNYGIKRKSTPNHIGFINFFNNKSTNRTISIKNPLPSIHNISHYFTSFRQKLVYSQQKPKPFMKQSYLQRRSHQTTS